MMDFRVIIIPFSSAGRWGNVVARNQDNYIRAGAKIIYWVDLKVDW
jgi:hypothetical protein